MIFETSRLIIRDFLDKDFQRVHELVQIPEIYKYQSWGPNSEQDTLSFINTCISEQKESPRKSYEMAITERSTGELFGAIGMRVRNYNKADIGYWVRHDKWGQGFATEASLGLLKFGFSTLDLNKIIATASPENMASIKVLEKLGMRQEGVLKEDLYVRGSYRDSVLMAVLKNDFVKN